MRVIHDVGRSVSLFEDGEDAVWKYVYAGKPKPYFHPVRTPSGVVLTNFEPHDHLWHRGLWFTFKFVDGDNFWEENHPFGVQESGVPVVDCRDGRAEMTSSLNWIRPKNDTAGKRQIALREERRVIYSSIEADAYALDFDLRLTPCSDVVLDRTPYTTWGGYGGLVMRGTRNWQQTRILLSDGSTTERPVGEVAQWADLSGKLDGGPEATGGFAFFEHPANASHPTPWYGGAEKHQNYLNAAMLFHGALKLEANETLVLRYRVLVHDNLWLRDRLAAAYADYVRATPVEDER